MSWAIALAAAILTLALVYVLHRVGLFAQPKAEQRTIGPFLIVYTNFLGPYSKIGTAFNDVISTIKANPQFDPDPKFCGLYFDDPSMVEAEKCRSTIGFVYKEGASLETVGDVERYRTELDSLPVVKEKKLQVAYFPKSECVLATFPMFPVGPFALLSLIIGTKRCYPLIEEARKQLPKKMQSQMRGALELYDNKQCEIIYSMPYTPRTELLPFPRVAATATSKATSSSSSPTSTTSTPTGTAAVAPARPSTLPRVRCSKPLAPLPAQRRLCPGRSPQRLCAVKAL